MKVPERTTQGVKKMCYIWEKKENSFNLLHVCTTQYSGAEALTEISGKQCSPRNIYRLLDTMIYFKNKYIVTSNLRFKSKETRFIKRLLVEYSNPATGSKFINNVLLKMSDELDCVDN